MTDLMQDASYAVRGLLRRPAFAVVVLATLALGIGANAAIFSVVSGILLHPLPYPNAERLFSFGHEPPHWLTSQPDFLDYQRGMRTLDGLAAYTRSEATITGRGEPERVRLVRSSDAFFAVLRVPPLFGRTFAEEEYVPRQAPTVVISYDLLQRRFGGDPSIVGSKITINGFPRIIVGVMPPHFDYPEKRTDAWMPLPRFKATRRTASCGPEVHR